MERLFPRRTSSLDVQISLPANGVRYKAEMSDVGLGGGFVRSDLPLSTGEVVTISVDLPDSGCIETRSRVVRKDGSGFALEFLGLDAGLRSELWGYLKDRQHDFEECPYCGSAANTENTCVICKRNVAALRLWDYGSLEKETHQHVLFRVMEATDELVTRLQEIDRSFSDGILGESDGLHAVTNSLQDAYEVFRLAERVLGMDSPALLEQQVMLRNRTDHLVRQSYFLNRARVWPQGHPGDYLIIEGVYRDITLSRGIGLLLDRYFLNNILARAVRARKQKMAEMLTELLDSGSYHKIMNIGCGSCRELFELVPRILETSVEFICLDMDSDALVFAAERFALTDVADRFRFVRYNVLRMVNGDRNRKEFGEPDVIYSMGLLDYLDDNTLLRLIPALYETVRPGGMLVLVFKDGDRYQTQDYHWMVDWNQFKQRSAPASRSLLRQAGLPDDCVSVCRDDTGVIIFYTVARPSGVI